MVLHVHPDHAQINVLPGVHVATDQSDVQWLIEHSAAPTRYFIGYAGWGGGQLEEELQQGAWQVLPATIEHLFHPPDDLWDQLTRQTDYRARHSDLPDKLIPKNPSNN
jgi:putative transcriptional regulator